MNFFKNTEVKKNILFLNRMPVTNFIYFMIAFC